MVGRWKTVTWQQWSFIAILLSIPALLINLGLNPFIEDEAIRATVALEMKYSGNYITPTIRGDYYFSKPPLYNWILLAFTALWGSITEWSTRLPTIFFLLLFCYYLYRVHVREGFSARNAVLTALIYLTCGRILFWDSFLGLIDICFSLVMYVMMVEMYRNQRRNQLWHFFLIAYILAGIGFLLKGYPALAFLGLTMLLTIHLYGKWKSLVSWSHAAGISIAAMMIGGYYLLYSQYHEVTETISPLLDQATRRTLLRYDLLSVIKHVVTYPFENIYHFLPWTLMTLLLLRKDLPTILRQHPFVQFSAYCFLLNILVYWVSPEVFPRYILMLVPMAFTVFVYFYDQEKKAPSWRIRSLHVSVHLLVALIPVVLLFGLQDDQITIIENWVAKSIFLFILVALLITAYFRNQNTRLIVLVSIVLVLRIGFNTFVLPIRTATNIATFTKAEAIRIAETYGEAGLSAYEDTEIDFTSTFYLERELGYILEKWTETPYEIIDLELTPIPEGYTPVDSFLIRRDENILSVITSDEN